MAYDKVVDSAQLEAAITASADAIREKTGDTALIQWLSDKGFAEAIAAIEAGDVSEDLNAVLNTQEAKLEELLLAINLKSAGDGATIETWELALTDDSVIEKRVVVA